MGSDPPAPLAAEDGSPSQGLTPSRPPLEHDCVCGVETAATRPDVCVMPTTTERHCVPAQSRRRTERQRATTTLDALLDLALAHTFPASDPVAVGVTGTE